MTELRGRILDAATGHEIEARVHVLASTGEPAAPETALRKVGTGEPFFYSDGAFTVDLPRGQADIVVERGTEYLPLRQSVDVPLSGALDLDLPLTRWINMPQQGWYAGNTHVHYDETETRPDERLASDPRVEDLPVFIVSRLQRRELAYASNAFPIGRHPISTPELAIDVGEETRHNAAPWSNGYGHLMLINLARLVEPLSRGVLVDDSSPDYPPLMDACAAAHGQGGLAIWCHNGEGMEAPVAAALGQLDGLNLFDPYWLDPEYDIWYALLNCGTRLPASTGSDWFLCSSNRVYVDIGADFSYEAWLAGLRDGRTFVTDGPILRLSVEGHGPGNELLGPGARTRRVGVTVEWACAQPLAAVEIVRDGAVVAREESAAGALGGRLQTRVDVADAGWLAARAWGRARTSYGHALWAHTSPVYLREASGRAIRRAAASGFIEQIDRSITWLTTIGRFADAAQRNRMLELFGQGRQVYERLAG